MEAQNIVQKCMKHLLFLLFLFSFELSFSQLKVDTAVRTEYWKLFNRLPEDIKNDKTEFKNGLGILISMRTDTLNKKDHEPVDTSLKIFSVTGENGEPLNISPTEEETINSAEPQWLGCGCRYKGDTLEIAVGLGVFSSFEITTRLMKGKAVVQYSEYESEGKVFKTKLTKQNVSQFTIPATITYFFIDSKPRKELSEIYGKIGVITRGFYSYVNAWDFKHGYIYKQMRYEYYFRCNIIRQRNIGLRPTTGLKFKRTLIYTASPKS